jgi:hypothetical protein
MHVRPLKMVLRRGTGVKGRDDTNRKDKVRSSVFIMNERQHVNLAESSFRVITQLTKEVQNHGMGKSWLPALTPNQVECIHLLRNVNISFACPATDARIALLV